MSRPEVFTISIPVKGFRRKRSDWDGHCHCSYMDGEPRPCEAPELCWPNNVCFYEGTDRPLIGTPEQTVEVVRKSDYDALLNQSKAHS